MEHINLSEQSCIQGYQKRFVLIPDCCFTPFSFRMYWKMHRQLFSVIVRWKIYQ